MEKAGRPEKFSGHPASIFSGLFQRVKAAQAEQMNRSLTVVRHAAPLCQLRHMNAVSGHAGKAQLRKAAGLRVGAGLAVGAAAGAQAEGLGMLRPDQLHELPEILHQFF